MSLHSVGITHGPRDSPRANQLLDNSAVVTFMVHPSKTKIETPCFPVAGTASPLPTALHKPACRRICCWSMVRGVCSYTYVYAVERAACIADVPAWNRLPIRHESQV